MALTKSDREYFRLTMSEEMTRAMKPIVEKNETQDRKLQKIEQTLYGENGTNGLNSDIKSIKKTVEQYRSDRRVIVAYASTVAATVSVAATYLKQKIFGG